MKCGKDQNKTEFRHVRIQIQCHHSGNSGRILVRFPNCQPEIVITSIHVFEMSRDNAFKEACVLGTPDTIPSWTTTLSLPLKADQLNLTARTKEGILCSV